MKRTNAAEGESRGEAGGQERRPKRTRGAPRKGEGRTNCHRKLVAVQSPPSSSILTRMPIVGREGDRRGSAGCNIPDCVEACRAAAALALAPTVVDLSLMFLDVLRLL